MDAYSRVIRSARDSIDSYFASCSHSPEKSQRPRSALRTAFEAAEQIYANEESLAMQQLHLVARDERPLHQRHLREQKSYEKEYFDRKISLRHANSSSPRKPILPNRISISRQSSKALSPSPKAPLSRKNSLHDRRSSRIHSVITVCTQAAIRRDSRPLSRAESKERKSHSHLSLVAKTIQQVDAPSELLEPMYYLQRQADLSLHTDAVRMKLEQQNSANTSSGQIRLMVARTAVHRRSSRARM